MAKAPAFDAPPLIVEARERFQLILDAEKEVRNEAKIDLRFLVGDQWNPKAKKDREDEDRPVLVVNKLDTFVHQVANNARQQRPSIKISRGDNIATKETATVYEGLTRNIQYKSKATIAFDNGVKNTASCSMGAWRVTPKYIDPRSSKQELTIEPIYDALGVYWDPAAVEYDRQDANYVFIPQRIHQDDYKLKYGKSKLVGANFFTSGSNPAPDWVGLGDGGKYLMIAEYWEVKKTEETQIDLIDGTGIFESDLKKDPSLKELLYRDEKGNLKTRKSESRQLIQHFINGIEELEEPLGWPGKHFPIIPIWGEEVWLDGKRHIISLIRFQRDPQQLYNFYATTEAEMISDMPKSPWIGFVGQFKTKLLDWAGAGVKKIPFLEADPVPMPGGGTSPLPTRNTAEPPVQALIAGKMQASDEMKAASGQFDPSLGINKGDQSGTAINQLRSEGDVTTFHFIDNQARSIETTGRVIVDLIPYYYDTEMDLEILGEDMKPAVVRVNTDAPHTDDKGQTYHHQLTKGKYNVTVSKGPSVDTQREENFEMLMALAKNSPEVFSLMADVVFQFADFEGADILVQRFKAMLPPAVQALDKDGQSQIPPEVQMQIQKLSQELQGALNDLKNKLSEKKMEQDTKKEIAALQAWATVQVAAIKAGVDAAVADAENEASHLEQVFDGGLQMQQQAADHAHDLGMQAHAAAIAPQPEPEGAPAE